MNPQKDNIYTFKLGTGEEIVAKVLEVQDDYLILQNPIHCMLTPQGLQMMPALFSADLLQSVRLNNHSWVLVAEARDDVRNSWIEATTGIRPATRQIITG